jgi:biotin operon repressor
MQPNTTEEITLDRQLDEICDGFREAVAREVETLRREGLPIYVAENGRVVNLQEKPGTASK